MSSSILYVRKPELRGLREWNGRFSQKSKI